MLGSRKMIGDLSIDHAVAVVSGEVGDGVAVELFTLPVSEGLVRKNGFGISALTGGDLAAGLAGEGLELFENGIDDFWFGFDFESGGAGGPGGVSAESVLLGRRDVSGGTVGEFDVEGGLKGAAGFELEAGNGVDFVRSRGDREVADAEGLEDDFFSGVGVEIAGLLGVNFGSVFGTTTFHCFKELIGPGEPFLIGEAPFESEDVLGHANLGGIEIGCSFQGLL